jgi:hypothetical protein
LNTTLVKSVEKLLNVCTCASAYDYNDHENFSSK